MGSRSSAVVASVLWPGVLLASVLDVLAVAIGVYGILLTTSYKTNIRILVVFVF